MADTRLGVHLSISTNKGSRNTMFAPLPGSDLASIPGQMRYPQNGARLRILGLDGVPANHQDTRI
jgi:hypothetical protein